MTVDVLAVGPHPDDVELGCGGTLALLTRKKLRVGILHLTLGEAGTRGSSSDRRKEAEEAASRLGVAELPQRPRRLPAHICIPIPQHLAEGLHGPEVADRP